MFRLRKLPYTMSRMEMRHVETREPNSSIAIVWSADDDSLKSEVSVVLLARIVPWRASVVRASFVLGSENFVSKAGWLGQFSGQSTQRAGDQLT